MRGVVMVEDVVVNARYKINNAWRCGGGGRGRYDTDINAFEA